MKRVAQLGLRWVGLPALAALALAGGPARAAVAPFRSMGALPSSNGIGALAWNVGSGKVTQFLEHPYARASASSADTRNFAYDAYPGVRVGATGVWLSTVAPTKVEYVAGTGIVHVTRETQGLRIEQYEFMPMASMERVSYQILKITRLSGQGAVDAYSLSNYRLGAGAPLPSPQAEQAQYVASRDAIYEYGPSNVAFAYATLGAPASHHSMSPQNPFAALNAGQNLADNLNSAGPRDDIACGMQQSLGDLAVGQTAWAGFLTVLDLAGDAQAALDRVRGELAGRGPEAALLAEQANWTAWHAAGANTPTGANAAEAQLARQSAAVLRMAQVREAGAPNGQILASLATGKWNISWVRDMAYAVVALARAGHVAEAQAAIDFQLRAQANQYPSYVGAPYAISVVRYFGNGTEESDSNEDGPNIEFDGFGLFLWELAEVHKASGDRAALRRNWPKASREVANVLVGLQEPAGLIKADSSIWEVHWNGKQKRFVYTTATAANGLCLASGLAGVLGDAALQAKYLAAGARARDALLTVRAPDGTLAQSPEGLAAGSKFLDASVLEAFNFGLLHPRRATALATVASITRALLPPSGRGLMRSDVGAWYDSQEWIFVDLRSARVLEQTGNAAAALGLQWNVEQARDNFDLFSELHERSTAQYVGEAPMAGFGGAAYLLALGERGVVASPVCGAYASEPPLPGEADAGPDAAPGFDGGNAGLDGGTVFADSGERDAGADSGSTSAPLAAAESGCSMHPSPSAPGWLCAAALSAACCAVLARRRRARRKSH